ELDDLVQLGDAVERRADVEIGEHGNTQTAELRTPVGYEQPIFLRPQRRRFESERPETEPSSDDQCSRRNAPRPLHAVGQRPWPLTSTAPADTPSGNYTSGRSAALRCARRRR